MEELNIHTDQAFRETLFTDTENPQNFGWLLRPARRDWDEFVSQSDRLLAENLRHSYFDANEVA